VAIGFPIKIMLKTKTAFLSNLIPAVAY